MSRMEVYTVSGGDVYEPVGELVVAKCWQQARMLAVRCNPMLWDDFHEIPDDVLVRRELGHEINALAQEFKRATVITADNSHKMLRLAGFRFDGDNQCECCMLYSIEDRYPICEKCGHCDECGPGYECCGEET